MPHPAAGVRLRRSSRALPATPGTSTTGATGAPLQPAVAGPADSSRRSSHARETHLHPMTEAAGRVFVRTTTIMARLMACDGGVRLVFRKADLFFDKKS